MIPFFFSGLMMDWMLIFDRLVKLSTTKATSAISKP